MKRIYNAKKIQVPGDHTVQCNIQISAFRKSILTSMTFRIHWHYPHTHTHTPPVAMVLNIYLKETELGMDTYALRHIFSFLILTAFKQRERKHVFS